MPAEFRRPTFFCTTFEQKRIKEDIAMFDVFSQVEAERDHRSIDERYGSMFHRKLMPGNPERERGTENPIAFSALLSMV